MTIEPQKMEELKRALLEEKTKLESDLSKMATAVDPKEGEYEPTMENIGSDREDNTTEVEQFTDNLPVEAALEAKLKDTIEALEEMDAGTYGVCKNCNEEIDIKRLEINPSARTCIKCGK